MKKTLAILLFVLFILPFAKPQGKPKLVVHFGGMCLESSNNIKETQNNMLRRTLSNRRAYTEELSFLKIIVNVVIQTITS